MWFKNLFIYRFSKPFEKNLESLENDLATQTFHPCGDHDQSKIGWCAPIGESEQSPFVHVTDKFWMICLKKQDRILPASVINEQVAVRVTEIEHSQSRKVTKKEKQEIKEQVAIELLPKSFTKTQKHFAYLCPSEGYMVLNTASGKVADELTSFLRKTIGSLPVRTPETNQSPAALMTSWLTDQGELPSQVSLGDECELISQGEDKGQVRYKGLDLHQEQLDKHIEAGMQVASLAIHWGESVSFNLNSDLIIKRLKFKDIVTDQFDDMELEDENAKFDASFSLMAFEVDRLIPELLGIFGGENLDAVITEAA